MYEAMLFPLRVSRFKPCGSNAQSRHGVCCRVSQLYVTHAKEREEPAALPAVVQASERYSTPPVNYERLRNKYLL